MLRPEEQPVHAAEDVLVAMTSVHNIKVSAHMEGREDWLVEKVIIGKQDLDVLASPTIWIAPAILIYQ
jgi:hypothetical protein